MSEYDFTLIKDPARGGRPTLKPKGPKGRACRWAMLGELKPKGPKDLKDLKKMSGDGGRGCGDGALDGPAVARLAI